MTDGHVVARRSSDVGVGGIATPRGVRKVGNAFMQVFQGKKSEGGRQRRFSSSSMKEKRQSNKSMNSFVNRTTKDDTEAPFSGKRHENFERGNRKSHNNTWSSRKLSEPFRSSQPQDRRNLNLPQNFASLSHSKKERHRGEKQGESEPFVNSSSATPTSFVGLFTSPILDNSDFIEIACDPPSDHADVDVSHVNSADCDAVSARNTRGQSSSSKSSISLRSYLSPMSSSHQHPPLSKDWVSSECLCNISSKSARRSPIFLEVTDVRHNERIMRTISTRSEGARDEQPLCGCEGWRSRATTPLRSTTRGSGKNVQLMSELKTMIKRPSIIQRPQTMVINLPGQYSASSPDDVAGLDPSPRSRPGSVSQPVSGYQGNATTDFPHSAGKLTGYNDEDNGMGSAFFNSHWDRERISGSYESLDEVALDTSDMATDPDLIVRNDEPDSWSATIDKRSLKRLPLTKKDVKRQENIFEFIQTERNHLTTLKIMQKVYARGLAREINMDPTTINKLFPLIDEHVEFVTQFVQKLTERQNDNKVVSGIGDILVAQWSDSSGEAIKKLFGDFCSKQKDITNFYKELMKSDKKFQTFMKKWDKNPITRRQDVPTCALLITQRITKYPIMLQTLIDNSNKNDHKEDYQSLEKSLELSREIAKAVDDLVQAHEREQLLLEIYNKIETKSSSSYKDGRKFDRKDLLKRNRKLLYSANLQWNVKDNKKFTDIYFLLLSDSIVFLQENSGRYTFPPGQPAAVPLQRMIVREVAGDEKGLYLMSMTTQLMYSLKLPSVDDCKMLMHTIRLAIGTCLDEDEDITSEVEEERRLHEQRVEKANQAMRQLELTDQRINRMLEEKMRLFKVLAECADRGSAVSHLHFSIPYYPPEERKVPSGSPLLLTAIEKVTKLSQAFYGHGGLSRHPSSKSEEDRSFRPTPSLPKRSDTFGGFDKQRKPPSRDKWLKLSQSDDKLTELEPLSSESPNHARDSGLVGSETGTHLSESRSSISKPWDACNDITGDLASSGDGEPTHSGPTAEQVATLTTLAHILSEYQSCAVQQDTLVEKLNYQLSSPDRFNSAKKRSLQEAELKRNQIKQQEQIDGLRKQQSQLRSEREQWQKQVERFQRSLDNDKKQFEEEKMKIFQEREENEKRKIEIMKAKEEYQRDLMRLRDLQRKHDHASSMTSCNSNNNNVTVNTVGTHPYPQLHDPESCGKLPSPHAAPVCGDQPQSPPGHLNTTNQKRQTTKSIRSCKSGEPSSGCVQLVPDKPKII